MSGSVGGVTPGSTQALEVDMPSISGPDKDHVRMQHQNQVTQIDSHAEASTGDSPTAGAREATQSAPLSYEETERLTAERLASNPSYREAEVKLDTWKDLENDFALIDQYTGVIPGDGVITLENLRALANDPFFPNEDAKAAANRLLSHMSVWNELAKGDNRVGTQDVTDFVNGMRAKLSEMKDTARAQIVAEHAPLQNPPGSTPANGGTAASGTPGSSPASGTQAATGAPAETPEEAKKKADAKAIMEEAGKALPKPPPSQFSGLEGASDNMNNMIGWAEAETDRLTTLMGKTDDPAVLKQLETKINQMSRRMQQMTALMNQLMTAMQNISKMYSDIAMNSVRNIR